LTGTRNHLRLLALGAAAVLIFAACSSTGSSPSAAASTAASEAPSAAASTAASEAPSAAAGTDLTALYAAAKAEGNLTTIALPHDWCNYGKVIDGFKAKYPGIAVNELVPDAGSGDEIEAIKANKGNTGPQAPDVVDVGLSFGPQAKTDGLIQPYKVSTWDTIPASAKDADGYWYGDYYGVLAFETNNAIVKTPPATWADLLKSDYKGQIALAGDPRVSNQAIQAVYSSALSNGGSLDNAAPGLDFWKKVNDAGNFVPVIAKPGTIDQGATPITIRWTYNALSHRDTANGNPTIVVSVPTDQPPFAGVYVQAISAYAPHPNAAKLWMEYLYSDEGQLGWLSGYCYPIRFENLKSTGAIPADVLAKLPDATGAVFPTLDQLNKASEVITKGWDTVVGVNVK
jgi:putative spermidine/putrescine transport system substrate-binding protein